MILEVKTFLELTLEELYESLQLRSEIFVVEQNCVYQDTDGKDQKALHVLGKKDGNIIAYTRLFNANDYYKYASIGRVVIKKSERELGYGHDLISFSIKAIQEKFNKSTIKIGAQTYLKKFYESHKFNQIGEEYIEDGIPHIYMIRNLA
ncbi:GNAT family N-acetyltransferase [Flavobacteriales bacterium]|nr:GNAT family N-acetyltransferase [Flavobacteriales bacterium]MDA9262259.1 GNAT family N-acetyltransferase [bacterium]